MENQVKRLSKDTIIYGLNAALQKFITFLLFPLYARLLSKEDFGLQDVVLAAIIMLSVFLVLGMDSGVLLHYYAADDKDKERIRSTWLWSELLIAIIVCLPLWFFATPISRAVFGKPEVASYFRLAILSVPFSRMAAAILFVLRLTFQAGKFILMSTTGVLFQVLASFLFVLIWRKGVYGVFLAILVASVVQALFGLILAHRLFHSVFSIRWLKAMLVVGIPLIPVALSVWVMNYSNRYFLMHYDTLSDIGMFSVAMRISSILLFVLSAFEIAWGPFAYSLAQDPESARRTYAKVLTYFLVFSIGATVYLSIFAREVTRLLATSAYESTAVLVPLLCFSSICWITLYIVGMGVGIAKKTYHNSIAITFGVLINTILNFVFIPSWGIMGASLATLGGNFIAVVYMYFAGQHYFRVAYEYKKLFVLGLVGAISIGVGIGLDQYFNEWNAKILIFKAAVIGLFILSLMFFRVLRPDSMKLAWNFVRSRASLDKCR